METFFGPGARLGAESIALGSKACASEGLRLAAPGFARDEYDTALFRRGP